MNTFGDHRSRLKPAVETVPSLLVGDVPEDRWREFIAWIDPRKDAAEVECSLAEFERRWRLQPHSPAPLEARIGDQRVAGAYMMLLGARVAALAGVRGIDNHTNSAAGLLVQLVQQVRVQGVLQIQAILDGADSIATEIVEQAGFIPLAELQQLALTLPHASPTSVHDELPAGLSWIPASEVPRPKMTQLLAHTFIETLDCPALNGVRTPDDVLDGFLDGHALHEQTNWWALATQDRLIGCSLVNPLPSHRAELVYMGLGPTSRGRGYGSLLLQRAIRSAMAMQADLFLAAVDCANWPAMRLYHQAGFREHARVQAWFHQARN